MLFWHISHSCRVKMSLDLNGNMKRHRVAGSTKPAVAGREAREAPRRAASDQSLRRGLVSSSDMLMCWLVVSASNIKGRRKGQRLFVLYD